jgi:tetratricopeptide repeat protein 21B
MEKEQAYQDAAKNYENAWKFGNQNNPGIGKIYMTLCMGKLESICRDVAKHVDCMGVVSDDFI